MDVVYLDHAASTPLAPEARASMLPWLGERYGNPSSRHKAGVAAARAVETARTEVARAIGARSSEIVFTAGGTEANNLAVFGAASARRASGMHVLVGPTEHACVRESTRALSSPEHGGFEVETLRLANDGSIDLEHAARALRSDTVLVAQMLVQNETGTIYPVRELVRLVRARSPKAHVHVDAVQAFGKIELDVAALGCDTLAVSSHKLHGPQGVGASWVRERVELRPLVFGGGQERGFRSGTENVAGCVGFGTAARVAEAERVEATARVAELRAELVRGLASMPGTRVLEPGKDAAGLVPHVVAILFGGVPAEVRLNHLEELGVVVGAGSACNAKKASISPSLAAIGLDLEGARSMLRVSFARTSMRADVARLLEALAAVERKLAPLAR